MPQSRVACCPCLKIRSSIELFKLSRIYRVIGQWDVKACCPYEIMYILIRFYRMKFKIAFLEVDMKIDKC
jgi:hypothetical protein